MAAPRVTTGLDNRHPNQRPAGTMPRTGGVRLPSLSLDVPGVVVGRPPPPMPPTAPVAARGIPPTPTSYDPSPSSHNDSDALSGFNNPTAPSLLGHHQNNTAKPQPATVTAAELKASVSESHAINAKFNGLAADIQFVLNKWALGSDPYQETCQQRLDRYSRILRWYFETFGPPPGYQRREEVDKETK